jgi:hypothetical protein
MLLRMLAGHRLSTDVGSLAAAVARVYQGSSISFSFSSVMGKVRVVGGEADNGRSRSFLLQQRVKARRS